MILPSLSIQLCKIKSPCTLHKYARVLAFHAENMEGGIFAMYAVSMTASVLPWPSLGMH